MIPRFFFRHRYIILYGASLALLLFLLKWLEWRYLIMDHAIELYSGAIAVIFTGLGIWLAIKLARPKLQTVIVEKEVYVKEPGTVNEKELARLGLSARELEVLQLMAEGLSNQEIAARLFVSLNTIKTHSANIFEKLDVRRRTQAIDKAKRLNIIL
ncbi:MAG TPA: LuxR C-terminal-related transcriptional regulator [Puia sp.]|jgi:NarL family two-component system response regulator LiaR|nr:LuxR C-terminal-related transcriptional regulator [Puia sp.]